MPSSTTSVTTTTVRREIVEGSAAILLDKANSVFYNEVQVKNRDVSVLVLNAFAEQVELEAKCQVQNRKRNLPWRKPVATIQSWGSGYYEEQKKLWLEKDICKADVDIPEKNIQIEGLFILEALGASGLRSMRYANEVTKGVGVDRIICNDLEEHAVEQMKANIAHNVANRSGTSTNLSKIYTNVGDATTVMMQHRLSANPGCQHTKVVHYLQHLQNPPDNDGGSKTQYTKDYEKDAFDVIDIDPYGGCSLFLDSAVQAVRDGGLLCVTSTDLATLCGKDLEVCYAKYGVMSIKAKYCHEFALRVILGCLERHANKYGRFIVPLFSMQTDFYLRCFVRVYSNKAEIKRSATKSGLVLQSPTCGSFYIQPFGQEVKHVHKPASFVAPSVCPETGVPMKLGGPIWTDPIHNFAFLKQILQMYNVPVKKNKNPYLKHWAKDDFRKEGLNGFDPELLQSGSTIYGIVTAASEELQAADACLFHHLHSMCKVIKISCPPIIKVQSALINAGFKVSQVHCCAQGLKTNAPSDFLWDVLRTWYKKTSPEKFNQVLSSNDSELEETQKVQKLILSKEIKHEINFEIGREVMRMKNKRKGIFISKDGRKTFTKKVARWKPNPKPNWGPKSRAKGKSNLQTHKK